MHPSNTQAFWAAVRSDFKTFVQVAFAEVYPGKEFVDNWHIDAIVHCLEQGYTGKMPRLIVNMPPRHLKSFIVSVAWPAFILALDPRTKVVCVSYSDDLTRLLARDSKRIMVSQWYRELFPDVTITKSTENEIVTSQNGGRYSTSVGGTLTGRGAEFIIIDDPIKAADARSDAARNKNNEWFKTTLLSRLEDQLYSALIIVMQRLHVNDLTGYVQGTGGFHTLSLPAIALENQEIPIGPGLIHERLLGQPLCEDLQSLETLERVRDEIGPTTFAAQYQQKPDAPEGALFKLKYFKFIKHHAKPACGHYWVSIDSAQSLSETANYSAITIGHSVDRNHYILFAERGRWDFETLLKKCLEWHSKLPNCTFIVERASSGISLIQSLQARRILVFNYLPRQDKMYRAAIALPVFAEGRVHILDEDGNNAWIGPFINELLSFPNGRFDDQVDSVSQAIIWAEPRVNSRSRVYRC